MRFIPVVVWFCVLATSANAAIITYRYGASLSWQNNSQYNYWDSPAFDTSLGELLSISVAWGGYAQTRTVPSACAEYGSDSVVGFSVYYYDESLSYGRQLDFGTIAAYDTRSCPESPVGQFAEYESSAVLLPGDFGPGGYNLGFISVSADYLYDGFDAGGYFFTDVTYTYDPAPVPLPAALAFSIAGMACLGGFRHAGRFRTKPRG